MISAAEAQQLLQQGRVAEAERAFALILERDPGNVQALNFSAMAAFCDGTLDVALSHIDKALLNDANNPLTLHNRGRILEAAQRYDDAAASQRAALKSAPTLHVARLHLARAHELAGESDRAIATYARALQEAQNEGRWLNPATTPPAFRSLIEHAVQLVREGRRAAIENLLEPVKTAFGASALDRMNTGLRVYFKEEECRIRDPRQLSTFFHFPDIPATPYLDLKLFPWRGTVEAATAEIRVELYGLLQQTEGREHVFTSEALEAVHLRGLNHPPSWNGYYFYRHGEARLDNHSRCPKTAATLTVLPLCRVRDHGPEVLFSVFTPGTHLMPHRGVTNTRVVAHLPLIVPDDCALVVGGEKHPWREGQIVVFDDTFEHEAWNRSDKTRVVLIFDVWNPFLTAAERAALAIVFGDIGDFRQAVESVP